MGCDPPSGDLMTEVSEQFIDASSACLARCLLSDQSSPSQAAVRSESALVLEQEIQALAPRDREVLLLRHFEELNNRETAAVLGLKETAASNRYFRALARLRQVLATSDYRAEMKAKGEGSR